MHIIFSHGHLSSPESHKIGRLAPLARASGFQPLAIDYRDLRDDPGGRVERLCRELDKLDHPAILVGSSMGGYVSVAAACRVPVAGLFLLAPALYLNERYPEAGLIKQDYPVQSGPISIVHGWHDQIIPWQNALRFAQSRSANLHLLDTDHGMRSSMDTISDCFQTFLRETLKCQVTPLTLSGDSQ